MGVARGSVVDAGVGAVSERWGIVANPTKPGSAPAVRRIRVAARGLGQGTAAWGLGQGADGEVPVAYTTPVHPGGKQTRELLDAGVTHIFAVGGDGTVAACAHEVMRKREVGATSAIMVPVPTGSANLFYRAVRALPGVMPARRGRLGPVTWVDAARVRVWPQGEWFTCLTAAGTGMSTCTIMRTRPQTGWSGYVWTGVRQGRWRRVPWTMEVGNIRGVPGFVRLFDTDVRAGTLGVTTFNASGILDWFSALTWALGGERGRRTGTGETPGGLGARASSGRGGLCGAITSEVVTQVDLVAEDERIHIDGEVLHKVTHATITVAPRALPVTLFRP